MPKAKKKKRKASAKRGGKAPRSGPEFARYMKRKRAEARRKKGGSSSTTRAKKGTGKRSSSRTLEGRVTALEGRVGTVERRVTRVEGYSLACVNAIRRHNGLKQLKTLKDSPSQALPRGKRTVAG